MLDALASEIDRLELCPREDELITAVALADRLGAKITAAFGQFMAQDRWMATGATSARSWLGFHARMTDRSAGRLVRQARQLAALPVCAGAYDDGRLSAGQIEAILGVLDEQVISRFADEEARRVPELIPLNVRQVALYMRAWKMRAVDALADPADPDEPTEPDRSLYHSKTLGDRYETSGSFDPEGGAVIDEALRRAGAEVSRSDDADDGLPRRSAAQRRADALVEVARFFLAHSGQKVGGRHRPHLNVVVKLEDLADEREGRVVNGVHLPSATITKLACDSVLHQVVVGGRGEILDYGTATQSIGVGLWNALVVRDEHCRFPGCDRLSSWCEGHHVVWFSRGGATSISNLVLVCSRHHHLLHQPGWGAKLRDGAVFEVRYPNGETRCTTPDRTIANLWAESA